MVKDTIDRYVDFENRFMQSYEKKHPHFIGAMFKLYEKMPLEKFGCQFLDESGKVTEEYTLGISDRQLKLYGKGLSDVSMTVGINKRFLDDFLDNDAEDFISRPMRSHMKFLVKSPYYFAKGKMRFGVGKK